MTSADPKNRGRYEATLGRKLTARALSLKRCVDTTPSEFNFDTYRVSEYDSYIDARTRSVFGKANPTGCFLAMFRIGLRQLDAAAILEDLRNSPGNRLENLKGSRISHMSIRINDQWRIYFRWIDHDAWDVEIVDYR